MTTYLIKEIIAMKIAPIKDRKLRKLIWNGELKKAGKYEGNDYVIATNVGGTGNQVRWAVTKEAVTDWMARRYPSSKIKSSKK